MDARAEPGEPLAAVDPRYAERVRESFSAQRAMALVGAQLGAVGPGECVIEMPYDESITQQHGYVHGGIIGTIADSAAGYAGMTLAPADAGVLTVEYKLNLLAPAAGETFLARGHVVRPGRTLLVTRADVFAVTGERERHCATLLQTLMLVTDRPERAAGAA